MDARALPGIVLAAASGLSGCAHVVMRGSVARVEGGQEAQVCLGKREVRVGDRVTLFRLECERVPVPVSIGSIYNPRAGSFPPRPPDYTVCRKERVGGGIVTRLLDEHMSIVKVDPGVLFEKGTVVEKE